MAALPASATQVADRARALAARINPGPRAAERSLPIRAASDEVQRRWDADRDAILEGIPVASSTLRPGADQGAWGTTFTVHLELDAPVPGVAAGLLAGKAVRRLKALAETGEIPTTDHTPAYRDEVSA